MSEERELNSVQRVLATVLFQTNDLMWDQASMVASRLDTSAVISVLTSTISSYQNEIDDIKRTLDYKDAEFKSLSDQADLVSIEKERAYEELAELRNQVIVKLAVIDDLNNRIEKLEEETNLKNRALDKAFEYGEKAEELYQSYKNLLINIFKKDRKMLIDDGTFRMYQDSIAAGVAYDDIPGFLTNVGLPDDIASRLRHEPEIISQFVKEEGSKSRKMTRECPSCNGKGEVTSPGGGKQTCPACGGHKRVSMEQWKALGGKNKPAGKKGGAKAYKTP
jgi:hypothetical protein